MVNNICAIQARMGSNRLPGKSLFKLGNETIIERCYIAASYVDLFSSVMVLTSNESKDDELCNYLETKNINYKRGSLNNVLSRFSNVIKDTKADNIVRLTGDNPLIDPEIIEGVLKKCGDELKMIGKDIHYLRVEEIKGSMFDFESNYRFSF